MNTDTTYGIVKNQKTGLLYAASWKDELCTALSGPFDEGAVRYIQNHIDPASILCQYIVAQDTESLEECILEYAKAYESYETLSVWPCSIDPIIGLLEKAQSAVDATLDIIDSRTGKELSGIEGGVYRLSDSVAYLRKICAYSKSGVKHG